MREKKKLILVNGRECELFYRKARSTKDIALHTMGTLNLLDELLRDAEDCKLYPKGVTTLQPISTREAVILLDDTRPANRITTIRRHIAKSGLFTFAEVKQKGKKQIWKYALMADDEVIQSAKKLREKIVYQLSAKI